jgi:hypothetical protein
MGVELALRALNVVFAGLPVGEAGRAGGDVDHGDLDSGLATRRAEVAAGHERGAVGAEGDGLDPGKPTQERVGEGDIDVGVEGASGDVDGGETATGLAADGAESAGQIQPVA